MKARRLLRCVRASFAPASIPPKDFCSGSIALPGGALRLTGPTSFGRPGKRSAAPAKQQAKRGSYVRTRDLETPLMTPPKVESHFLAPAAKPNAQLEKLDAEGRVAWALENLPE